MIDTAYARWPVIGLQTKDKDIWNILLSQILTHLNQSRTLTYHNYIAEPQQKRSAFNDG